jgi:LPS-assembly protein
MAANKHSITSLPTRMLSMAIASASAIAIADSELYPHQQWVCQAGADARWQCVEKTTTPGAYPQPAKAAARPGRQGLATPSLANSLAKGQSSNPYQAWDWLPKAQLTDPSQCQTGCEGAYQAPTPDWPDADQNPEQAALRANASSSKLDGQVVTLTGEVALSQGNRRLQADSASLNRDTHEVTVTGNIEVREPDLLLTAQTALLNTETNLGHFESARFLQHSDGIRGNAELIQRSTAGTLDLVQGSITQCTPDDEVWAIHASSIHLDNDEGWGSAKHARLTIKDMPVFYSPYLTFPIDERRKSGFLWPTLGSGDSNGFEFSAPYYLNLAPNYDATLAPRYIEKRGTMTELELRQLSRYGEWVLAGAQLKDDKFRETDSPLVEDEDIPPREDRWVGSVDHSGNILGISTRIDYSKVSDNDYFRDLSTDSLDIKRTTHLNQLAELGFRNAAWQARLAAQDYQTIDELLNEQYQLLPRFSVEHNLNGNNFEPEWLMLAEFTDFQHEQAIDEGGAFVTGQRAFTEVGASYPMRWAAGFFIPSAKVRSVSYDLDAYQPGDDDSPSASAPLASLDMGLVFERPSQFGGNGYIQTLEPRLYYLYSDQDQQQGNPVFDSRELNFSYSQLFRDTRFSGHDRLDDANQTAIGITSRFIDDTDGREVLSLNLGQIFYFEDREVQLAAITPADNRSNSAIASEIQYQPSEQLWLTQILLWDSRQDKLQEGGVGFHYQADNRSLYNLGYRFRREGASNLGNTLRDLSQVDSSLVLPLSERWGLFGRYRYDIEQNSALDQMAGIEYQDCCWMLRLLYQQGVEEEYLDNTGTLVVEQDYAFILEFQLKGLGSLGAKARNILEENILGYEDLE